MSARSRPAALALALLVVALLTLPAAASAQQVGGSVSVPAGTTQTGDVSVAGGTVVIEGTLDGSLRGFAGSVLVTGTVTGDVEVAAGSVTVCGTVEAAAGAVTLTETGRVGGSLSTGAGDVSIDGTVGGDVAAGADRFTLGPTAEVCVTVRYDAATADIADGATVEGAVERVDDISVDVGVPAFGDVDFRGPLIPGAVGFVFAFLANVLLGAVLLLAAPDFARRVADTGAGRPAVSLGVGLLALVGIPVALVLVAITVVGIPRTMAGLLVFVPVLRAGFVYGAVLTGTWLVGLADYDSLWGGLLVGLALPAVVSLVGLSRVVDLAYLLLGLGAFALAAVALRRGGRSQPGEGTETADQPTAGEPT